MREGECSLRQVVVLCAAGLLAPAADLLPGLLAEKGGGAAWVIPILLLPALLLWMALLISLFREEGSELSALLRRRTGKWLGGVLTLLYIMWTVLLLSRQVEGSAARMGAVYGGRGGSTAAVLLLLLAVWMLWGKRGAFYRAGELFWLGGAVALAGILLMGFARVEWSSLVPDAGDWGRQYAGWLPYLNVWVGVLPATVLLGSVPRRGTSGKHLFGWVTGISLAMAALVGMVLGQTGPGLAARLPQPFLVAVQGISLEGALARLEAPVAALWLLADFCREGLFLAALREFGGNRWGKWLMAGGAGAALLAANRIPVGPWMDVGGVFLGVLVPLLLWLMGILGKGGRKNAISCGE